MRRRELLHPILALALAGCEWFSTMSDPADIQPHEREPLPPPPHAVPIGGLPEYDLSTVEQVLPPGPPASPESVARGLAYYQTFCLVCHGEGGGGQGPIADQFPAIPPLTTARVAEFSDAYLFGLITKGRGLMPPYAQIPPPARWDVVHYLRTLPAGAAAPQPAAAAATAAPADTAASGGAP